MKPTLLALVLCAGLLTAGCATTGTDRTARLAMPAPDMPTMVHIAPGPTPSITRRSMPRASSRRAKSPLRAPMRSAGPR